MNWLDGILGFFGGASAFGAEIAQFFAWLANLLIQIAQYIWNAVVYVFGALVAVFKATGRFFDVIWNRFFKNILNRMFLGILKAHDWLEAHLAPVVRFLRHVREYLDRIYAMYLKPFLNLIQHLRRFLVILRLLHVKWAQKLDAQLLHLETTVAGAFLKVRGVVNAMSDVLNIIIDPSALWRKPHLIVSMRRAVPGIFRAVTGMPVGYFFPAFELAGSTEEQPIACDRKQPDFGTVTGLGFDVPYPSEQMGEFFLDGDTGVAADSLEPFAPLGYFTENFIRQRACYFDDVAGVDLGNQTLDGLHQRGGAVDAMGKDTAALFRLLVAA